MPAFGTVGVAAVTACGGKFGFAAGGTESVGVDIRSSFWITDGAPKIWQGRQDLNLQMVGLESTAPNRIALRPCMVSPDTW